MTETQKNIQKYKAAIPGLRERVMATAMLLVVSLSMVVSASFAWVTLSAAPEVSMLTTTVAANGNLEIALVNPDGNVPNEVAIGDSASTEGKNLVSANITWGNLVNLSDASYGLSEISLRPALLSQYGLDKAPLYGATYDADGRVKDVSATYKYATWTEAEDGSHYFAAGAAAKYGVRAITSVVTSNVTGNATINRLMTDARSAYSKANTAYLNLITGVTMVDEERQISCMDALAMLIEIYVNEKAESAQVSGNVYYDYSGVVTYTHDTLVIYQDILEAEGEALRCLANLQVYATDASKGAEYFKTTADLLAVAGNATTLKNLGIKLQSLATYRTNCTNLQNSITGLAPYAELYDPDTGTGTEELLWSTIGGYVNSLVDVGTATANDVAIGSLSVSNASAVLKDPLNVVINKGILKDTEQRLGPALADNKISMVVTVEAGLINMKNKRAYVTTSAKRPTLSSNDLAYSDSLESSGEGGDEEGKDSYGIAIDLWTRTNVDGAFLTLEGTTVYETVDDTCINKNGVETELFIASNSESTIEVYRIPDRDDTANAGAEVVWYNAITHSEIGTQAQMDEAGYLIVVKTKDIVVGYDGENRIWQDLLNQQLISEYSTTQGSGSCYIFYANPSDQSRILDLLKSFTIAFLDQSGTHIATAKLDVDNAYAINGKVTVPMTITSGVEYTDTEGEKQLAIMSLVKNTPTWVTAIMYLDGEQLTNEHVLAANEIEGRLNFQFGTGNDITSVKDGELQRKYRIITAMASHGNATSINPDNPITFDSYVPEGRDVVVTLTVEGDQPSNMSGFFVRSIGTTQGSRTEEEVFTKNDDGTWSATFKLTRPGEYYMRNVIVDGVEYALEQIVEEDDGSKRVEQLYPTVIIPGVTIGLVHTDPGSGMVLTAEPYYNVTVDAQIHAAADLNPSQVRALFREVGGDKEYTAVMSYDPKNDQWVGTARITASGTYMLEYLVLDGEYEPLEESQRTTLVVTLGLSTLTKCNSIVGKDGVAVDSTEFEFTQSEYYINMQAVIQDDAATPIEKQQNVKLYYHLEGSDDDDDGMIFEMTWDETDRVYKGSSVMYSAGTYYFHRLEVTIDEVTSIITNAPVAPIYISAPPAPPAFDVGNTLDYQFAPNGNATMTFNMFYAQTSHVWVVIENTVTGQTEVVRATLDATLNEIPEGATDETLEKYQNHHRYKVAVPKTTDDTEYNGVAYKGTQDGEWVIREIRVTNTFDDEGNKIPALAEGETPTEENSLVFNLAGKSGLTTYVVQTVNMSNTISTVDNENKSAGVVVKADATAPNVVVLGADANRTKSGDFMDYYNTTVTAVITDWKGNAIRGVTDVTLSITHDATKQVQMGGYSGGAYQAVSAAMSAGAATGSYVTTQKLQLAGGYTTELSFKVGSVSYSTATDASNYIPDFEVWSKSPTVEITAISNYKTSTSTATSATVYFNESQNTTCGVTTTNYSQPHVTITLTGYGNASGAKLTFAKTGGGDVHLYPDSTDNKPAVTTDFTWSANGTCKRWVGYWGYVSAGSDSKEPAGELKATVLVFTYDNVNYTFDVTDITINNPS